MYIFIDYFNIVVSRRSVGNISEPYYVNNLRRWRFEAGAAAAARAPRAGTPPLGLRRPRASSACTCCRRLPRNTDASCCVTFFLIRIRRSLSYFFLFFVIFLTFILTELLQFELKILISSNFSFQTI